MSLQAGLEGRVAGGSTYTEVMKNVISEISGAIGTITINRAPVLNALNLETLLELETVVREFGGDRSVRTIIITGDGEKAFVSGADIAAMKEMTPAEAAEFASRGHACMDAIGKAPKPVIAAVNGFALGGGTELAISCDIVYAADTARFGLPEVKLGLYPGFGGTQRLPRLIGASRARELIFSGRIISAKEAFEWGIVNRVVPQANLKPEVMKLAAEIAANAPAAVAKAKRLINECGDISLSEGLNMERTGFSDLFETTDRIEGLTAFLEKRKPVFRGE